MAATHTRRTEAYETNTYTSAIKSDTPAPIAYNVRVVASSPRFTMKSRIPPLKTQAECTQISPFSYYQDLKTKHDAPKFSMSFKCKTEKVNTNPAPNYYSPNHSPITTRSSIRLSGRTENTALFFYYKNAKFIPSPDTYWPYRRKTKVGYVFDKGYRGGSPIKDTSPGPAYLNVGDAFKKSVSTRKGASMAGRIETLDEKKMHKSGNIGPGSYNLPSGMDFGHGRSISGRTKMAVTIK